MGRGNDDVEFGQDVVLKIQAAVGEDVHLAAGEQLDPLDFIGGLVDLLHVLEQSFGGQAVGDDLALGVVGDGEEFVARGLWRRGPFPRWCFCRRRRWCGSADRRGCPGRRTSFGNLLESAASISPRSSRSSGSMQGMPSFVDVVFGLLATGFAAGGKPAFFSACRIRRACTGPTR